jgi:dihydrofolate reductase
MDMAKVIAWNMVTLDGFFEGEKSGISAAQSSGATSSMKMSNEFGAKAGLLVFGRVTYEGMRDPIGRRHRSRRDHDLHERPAEAGRLAHADRLRTGTTRA